MKLDELIQHVGVDNVGVQILSESITSAKQRHGYVEVSFGTDCVSMRDIATGQWENVVFVIRVKREAFQSAVAACEDEIECDGGEHGDA
ncbi:MAG TPA: hypothetical protein VMT67_11450 [Terriglobales bacterium]|nr:hypothetical protein [Terriglobales bacterium]